MFQKRLRSEAEIMNEAVRLNNDAIDLLVRSTDDSRMQDGIALFTRSLKALKTILVGKTEPSTSSGAQCSPRALGRRLAKIIDSPCAAHNDQLDSRTTESSYVCKRMFRLFANADLSVPNTIQICIACVIFNLALLHQHLAATMQPGKVRKCLLEKSALLYHSCSQIVPNILPPTKGSLTVPLDDVVFLLKVGALNNSAQILYECHEYKQACDRLDMVESILCVQGLSETQCCFTVQEFEGILANVMLLRPPTVAVAA